MKAAALQGAAVSIYDGIMKTLAVRLPEDLVAQIESESRRRKLSKSDVVRERLIRAPRTRTSASLDAIADLIGSVDALRPGLSTRRKQHLKSTGYGAKRPR